MTTFQQTISKTEIKKLADLKNKQKIKTFGKFNKNKLENYKSVLSISIEWMNHPRTEQGSKNRAWLFMWDKKFAKPTEENWLQRMCDSNWQSKCLEVNITVDRTDSASGSPFLEVISTTLLM